MQTCQRCNSDRLLSGGGKSSDMNHFNYKDVDRGGYVPYIENVGGGDDIYIEVCLECGQLQGAWPQPDPDFYVEAQDVNDLGFDTGDAKEDEDPTGEICEGDSTCRCQGDDAEMN